MALCRAFDISAESLEVTHYWYEPYHKAGCVFFLIWDLLCILLFFPSVISPWQDGGSFPGNVIALCAIVILVPAPTYWMLVHVINRTRIRLTRSKVIVKNGPLPWKREDHLFAIQDIKYIWTEEKYVQPVLDDDWYGTADETFHIKAIMKNGEPKYLIQNIQSLEDTRIACSKITMWIAGVKRTKLKEDTPRRPFSANHHSSAALSIRSKEDEA